MSYQYSHCSKRIMRFSLTALTALGILMGSMPSVAEELPAKCDTDPASCEMTAEQVKANRVCEDQGHESEACQQAIMEANKLPAKCDTDPASCEMTAEQVKANRVCEDQGHESEACKQAIMEAKKLPAKCDTDPASCEMTAEEVKANRVCEEKGRDSEACEQAIMEANKLPAKCDTDPASCEMTAEEVKANRVCEEKGLESEACEQAIKEAKKLPAKCDSDPASCEMTAGEPGELLPEFVSLNHKANFEKGQFEWKNNSFLIEKLVSYQESDEKTGEPIFVLEFIVDNELSIKMGTEDGTIPDGSFAIIKDSGISYVGEQLSIKEASSQVIKDYIVLVVSGIFGGNDESFPATIRITQSLINGGSSEIQIEGDKAYLNGDLGVRTYNQIFTLITEHPEVNTIVEVNVSGSVHDDINMQTGRLIRQAGLNTYVPGNGDIASGGVDLFCAGVNRTIEKGAKLGVHSWGGGGIQAADLPEDSPLHEAQIAYFSEMLGSPLGKDFYFYTINAAPAAEVHYMSPEEITRWQLGTWSENILGISQCATYNVDASPQIDVPCVMVGNDVFKAGLNQVNKSIRFEFVPTSLVKIQTDPSQDCGIFIEMSDSPELEENHLIFPCIKMGETSFWFNLKWVNDSPIQFELLKFGIK